MILHFIRACQMSHSSQQSGGMGHIAGGLGHSLKTVKIIKIMKLMK